MLAHIEPNLNSFTEFSLHSYPPTYLFQLKRHLNRQQNVAVAGAGAPRGYFQTTRLIYVRTRTDRFQGNTSLISLSATYALPTVYLMQHFALYTQ